MMMISCPTVNAFWSKNNNRSSMTEHGLSPPGSHLEPTSGFTLLQDKPAIGQAAPHYSADKGYARSKFYVAEFAVQHEHALEKVNDNSSTGNKKVIREYPFLLFEVAPGRTNAAETSRVTMSTCVEVPEWMPPALVLEAFDDTVVFDLRLSVLTVLI